jgi:hypothetical protein
MVIYICSKYSDNPQYRVKEAKEYCNDVIKQGDIPICPHLFYHGLKIGEDKGLAIGLKLLEICDELWVYGEVSVNMANEIRRARSLNIRVIYKN